MTVRRRLSALRSAGRVKRLHLHVPGALPQSNHVLRSNHGLRLDTFKGLLRLGICCSMQMAMMRHQSWNSLC
jgi:hypothetical protein